MHHSSVSWEVTLLYFFSWNCTRFGQKESIKVQNFRLSTAHLKFHQICTLIGSFCWKFIKLQLKKYRGVMSHDTEKWCKIWRKTDLLFQKWQEFDEVLTQLGKSLKHLLFDWFLLCKVFNVWPKKLQRSYHSGHWRVMQNLKKNWFVVWKMTWRIWQIFTRALKSVKIESLMGSFCPK